MKDQGFRLQYACSFDPVKKRGTKEYNLLFSIFLANRGEFQELTLGEMQ